MVRMYKRDGFLSEGEPEFLNPVFPVTGVRARLGIPDIQDAVRLPPEHHYRLSEHPESASPSRSKRKNVDFDFDYKTRVM